MYLTPFGVVLCPFLYCCRTAKSGMLIRREAPITALFAASMSELSRTCIIPSCAVTIEIHDEFKSCLACRRRKAALRKSLARLPSTVKPAAPVIYRFRPPVLLEQATLPALSSSHGPVRWAVDLEVRADQRPPEVVAHCYQIQSFDTFEELMFSLVQCLPLAAFDFRGKCSIPRALPYTSRHVWWDHWVCICNAWREISHRTGWNFR